MVMAEDKLDISEALSYYLHKRNMTVKRCAELCGFHRARLTEWKYGHNAATMEHIRTLCNVLDVPIEIFMNMCVERQYTAHNHQKRDRRYNNNRGCALGVDTDYISDFPVRNANGKWVQ